jgi:hypothetical protein
MDVVEALYSGYGESSGSGMRAGHQDAMFDGGDAYLDANFPKLDRLIRLKVTHVGSAPALTAPPGNGSR